MNTTHVLFAAAFAALSSLTAPSAQARIDRDVTKTFTVAAGGKLDVATAGGGIRIRTGGSDQVKVVAHEHIRAGSDAEADEVLKGLELTIGQTAAGVSAVAKYPTTQHLWHFGSWPPVQVDFEVVVPARYSVDLRTSGGGIEVSDLEGTALARTSGGSIELGRITGKVEAETSGGSISLAGCEADARMDTSGGSIRSGKIAGRAEIHTSGGSITLDGIGGGALSAHTSGGNVTATFTSAPASDCSLSTSGGNVHVRVPPGAGFELDAATSGGSVQVDGVTITLSHGALGKSRVTGRVGSGGPALKLRSSGGNVRLTAG